MVQGNASTSTADLIGFRQKLISEQGALRAAVKEEEQAANADAEKASCRRSDYGPAIQTWLRMLAENGVLGNLIEKTKASH